MSTNSSNTPLAAPRSGSARAVNTHYEELEANAWLDFQGCLADIFRGMALSDTAKAISDSAARGMQGPHISLELPRALWNFTQLPTSKPNALRLLDEWYSTSSPWPKEYWDDLRAEVAANRLKFRDPVD